MLLSAGPLCLFKFTCRDVLQRLMDSPSDIDNSETKKKYFKQIAKYFYLNRQSKTHAYVGIYFLLSSILCLIFTVLLGYVCSLFLNGQFLTFLPEFLVQLINGNDSIFEHHAYTVFPELGKCDVPQIDLNGNPYFLDALCNLNYNVINRKWFIVFFSFLVVMVMFSFITLMAHFTFLVSLKSRCYFILKLRDPNFKNNFKSPISGSILKDYKVFIVIHKTLIRRVIRKLSFGDYIILYFVIGHLSFSDATSLLTVLDNTMLSHINVE